MKKEKDTGIYDVHKEIVMFLSYRYNMQEVEFRDCNKSILVKYSVWNRVTRNLNKLCKVKRYRIFLEEGAKRPCIKGKKGGYSSYDKIYIYSTYGIHVGIDWLYKRYPFFKKDIERCEIIKDLYNVVPNIGSCSYKECLKYKKMIAFA